MRHKNSVYAKESKPISLDMQWKKGGEPLQPVQEEAFVPAWMSFLVCLQDGDVYWAPCLDFAAMFEAL